MPPRLLSPKPQLELTPSLFDRWLLLSAIALVIIGLLMVTSASMVISERQCGNPFHYVIRQLLFLVVGIGLGIVILRISISTWEKLGPALLLLTIGILILILIPGIGRSANGSTRWINLGFFGFQGSEFAKLSVVIYFSGYLVRHGDEIRTQLKGFLKPLLILGALAILLLLEPDFGATVVIITLCLGLLFLCGARFWQFLCLLLLVAGGLAVIAVASPYRMHRLTAFLNPWANQFDSGYQLTQSLIAFGRGGWTGVGLGASVQKLFYLPEAHTDFLFAVLAEELGVVGEILVIGLFALLVWRILAIGMRAYTLRRFFAAYMAYGFGLWIAFQALVNMGVNSGLLPTKGLTLPLMSYGGSSMIIICVVLAIVLRIDYETRFEAMGLGRLS